MARRWWRSGYSTKIANARGKSLSLDPLLCPSSPPSFRESSFSALGCIEARPRHPPPPPLGPRLVVFVLVPMRRLAPIEVEEVVHALLVSLQRLNPDAQVGIARASDSVHPARRPVSGCLPARLDDAVLLHPPESLVQSPGVHRLESEHPRSTHELVAVGVPLPKRQQDHRL